MSTTARPGTPTVAVVLVTLVVALAATLLVWRPWQLDIRSDSMGPYNVVDILPGAGRVDTAVAAVAERDGRVLAILPPGGLRTEPAVRAVFDVRDRGGTLAVIEDLRRASLPARAAMTEQIHGR